MNLRIIFFSAILFFIVINVQGQTTTDTIQIKYNYGTKFYYEGKLQKPKQLLKIMESNPQAHKQMKSAIGLRSFGDIIGSVGGFMAGYTLGRSFGEGKLNKNTLIAGGVLVVISIPVSLSYNKGSVKAVKMYNEGLRTSMPTDGAMLELRSGGDGIGLRVTF